MKHRRRDHHRFDRCCFDEGPEWVGDADAAQRLETGRGASPFGRPDHLPERFHREWWLRRRWRRFSGVHLRRRLFLWFGATIFLTTLVVASLAHMTRAGHGGHQIPGFVFILVPVAILWAATGKVARRIARPLDELVGVAQDIGAGRLDARARLHRGGIDEIAELSRAVNDMAARIERQLSDQRELLAGVSHEIRTPLARLRLLVEIGRERGVQSTNLDEIEGEVLEIDALVGELLASARLDFAALTPLPLDAAEVAARAAERAGVPAERVVVGGGDQSFVGDPTLLARALANLLKNAAVHGGGVERVRVSASPQGVEFAVLDGGPGFPPGDEHRVFDRFYRAGSGGGSPARAGAPAAVTARADGLGLGLALVRRIAEAHGGTATARNRPAPGGDVGPPGGAEVAISLPRASATPAGRGANHPAGGGARWP